MPAPGTADLASVTEQVDELETALTNLIRRAGLPAVMEASRRRAGVDLGRAAYSALVRVAELDGGRLSDVATALDLDASTTSRHVARLVDDGYVHVTVDDEDGRVRRFRPTRKGERALEQVLSERRKHLVRLLQDWEPEELPVVTRGLERILAAFVADSES